VCQEKLRDLVSHVYDPARHVNRYTLYCQDGDDAPEGIPTLFRTVSAPPYDRHSKPHERGHSFRGSFPFSGCALTDETFLWMLFGDTRIGKCTLRERRETFFGLEVRKTHALATELHVPWYSRSDLGHQVRHADGRLCAPTPVGADEGGYHEPTDPSETYPAWLIVLKARTPFTRGDGLWYPGCDLYPHATGFFAECDLVARMTPEPSAREESNRHNWDILYRHRGEHGPTKDELQRVLAWVAGHAWFRHSFYAGVAAHIRAHCLPDEERADAFVMGVVYRMRALQCRETAWKEAHVRREQLASEARARKADLAAKKRLRAAQEANVAENKRRRLVDQNLLEEEEEESDPEEGPPE